MSVTLPDIVRELNALPPERVEDVYDFVLFLKSRSGVPVDVADAWSDEDCRDVTLASLNYAKTAISGEEVQDAVSH